MGITCPVPGAGRGYPQKFPPDMTMMEQPELESLTTYNLALNRKIQELKDETPEEWQQLEEKAEELRSANQSDYTDLSSEALEWQGFLSITKKRNIPDQVAFSHLNSFPSTLLNHVTEWSRTLPVHIYCLVMFSMLESEGLKSYTYTSSTCIS
jgi:hypothetical protein